MATKGKPEGLVGLSVAEAKVILLGILCTDDSGKLDAEKLAVKGNYKNGASARTILRAARKALFEKNPGEDEASSSVSTGESAAPTDGTAAPASTPKTKTPTKRRKKGVAAAETDPNGNAEDEPATPKPKRQRKAPAKKVGASNPTPDIETSNNGAPPVTSNPPKNGANVEAGTTALTSPYPSMKSEDTDSTSTSELIIKGAMDDNDAIMTNAELDQELNQLDDGAHDAVKMEDVKHQVN